MPLTISLNPKLGVLLPAFRQRCSAIRGERDALGEAGLSAGHVIRMRAAHLAPICRPTGAALSGELGFLATLSVVIDLLTQGWRIAATEPSVVLEFPDGATPESEKQRIRRAHLIERDSQLQERSVVEFVRGMERRRLTPRGWHSIFSLMRDGKDLTRRLRDVLGGDEEDIRAAALSGVIRPYLQVVEPGAICEHTGIRLGDIWRYFRHTWVTSYRSVPGRSMMILVRDAAAPNHPVMGIASLASSVVQQSTRDSWIGWDAEAVVRRFRGAKSPRSCVRWLVDELDGFIRGIYVRDLLRGGVLTRADIRNPSPPVVQRLAEDSASAIRRHRLYPQAARQSYTGDLAGMDWVELAETSLYRSKRSRQLATMLGIRLLFRAVRLDADITVEAWRALLESGRFRRAIGQIVRHVKAARVGINMMDISVCGAVAPYNALLGGKLVSLLLCSPEITGAYRARYGNQVSLIASGMRGAGVKRGAQLALLCTTSLYGSSLNQYSRIKASAALFGGRAENRVEYDCLGMSEGFGSFHFSKETLRMMGMLLGRAGEARRVNSIFGEGVNPLMRKIREALTLLGLPADMLLRHGSKRLVYGVALASNFREVLLDGADLPRYLIPQTRAKLRTDLLVDYWRRRWLLRRLSKPGILDEIARHTCSYPVCHGARVDLDGGGVSGLLPDLAG
ncbi:MAG: DUF4338 domain-containing protein [Acidobacteria bacterium]|nr:MAG: DUF4338 domain-containing protein [Acidobacteriota bacterium]